MAISLGSINFGLGPDTSRLQAAIRQVQNFGSAVEAAAAATGRGARQTEAALRRQEKAAIAALQKTAEFNRALRNASAPPQMFQQTERAINTLIGRMTNGQRSTLDYQRAMGLFGTDMSRLNRELRNHIRETMEAGKGQSRMATILRDAASAAVIYSGPLGGMATRFTTLATVVERANATTAAFLAGLGGGAIAFVAMGRAAISAAKETDRVSRGLTSISGSSVLAQADMKRLMETANRAGISFKDISGAYTSFQAAAKGTNLEGERANKIFQQYIFSAKALGRTNEDITGGLRAMEQMMSKGVVQAEELRGQFGDRFPGAMRLAAQGLGVTTKQLGDMMKKGQVASDTFLPKFMDAVTKTFNIDITKPVDDILSAENRLGNAFLSLGSALDKTFGFSDAYKNLLGGLSTGINAIARNTDTLRNVLVGAAGAIAGFFAPTILAGLGSLLAGIRTLTAAVLAFNAATLANPMGAFAGLLVRLGLAAGGAVAGFKLMEAATNSSASALTGALPEVSAYINAQGVLKSSIRDTTMEYIKQVQVLQQGRMGELADAARGARQMQDTYYKLRDSYTGKNRESLDKTMGTQVQEAWQKVQEISGKVQEGEAQLKALDDILQRQTAAENKRGSDLGKDVGGSGSEKGANRKAKALRDAMQEIIKTEKEFQALTDGGTEGLDKLKRELEITDAIQEFRDKLLDAGVGADKAGEMTDRYAKAIRGLKEGMYNAKDIVTGAQMLQDVFTKFGEGAIDKFVDAIMEGKDVMQELGNVAKSVLADLTKEFLKLAVLNPLKNMLFNTNSPVFDWGALFGGAGVAAAKGLASTPGGFRFAQGGVMHSPTMFSTPKGPVLGGEAGPEAIMPLRRGPGGRLGVDASGAIGDPSSGPQVAVQIINQNGSNVKVSQGKGMDMNKIKIMIRDAMMEDLAGNGQMAQTMQGMYGLNRMKGR